jgi:hypothetical protein
MSNLSDGEGVGSLAFTTGSLRDDELGPLDVYRGLAVARGRVLLVCPFGLVRFWERFKWIWMIWWIWLISGGVLMVAGDDNYCVVVLLILWGMLVGIEIEVV